MLASSTSTLGHYVHRRSHKLQKSPISASAGSPSSLTSASATGGFANTPTSSSGGGTGGGAGATGGAPPPQSPLPTVPYALTDVTLNRTLYAGPACFDSETVLKEVKSHCSVVEYTKSAADTPALVASSLSTLDSINLLVLDMDPQGGLSPAVLIGKLRKMGFCGFAILLADVSTAPDSSDRFLRCGGDGILCKPMVNRRAVHRVLIGESVLSFSLPPPAFHGPSSSLLRSSLG
jgi:hypothetical protein